MAIKRTKKRPYIHYPTSDGSYRIAFYNNRRIYAWPGRPVGHFIFKGFDVRILKVSHQGFPYEYELRPYRDSVWPIFARYHCDVLYDVTSHKTKGDDWGAKYSAIERINQLLSPLSWFLQYGFVKP